MAVVSVLVPVLVAVEHYAAVMFGDLRIVPWKLSGRVHLLSSPLLLIWPTTDTAAVGTIFGAAEEWRCVGAAGRPEAARRLTDPKERPLTLREETHRGLWS